MNNLKATLSFTLFFCLSAVANEQNIQPMLEACASISDDKERLQCFDALVFQQRKLASNTSSGLPAEVKPVITSAPLEAEIISGPVLPSAAPVESETIKKQEQIEKVQQGFGLEHKKTQAELEVESLDLTITKTKKSVHGKWTLTFDNGQVWVTISTAKMKFKVSQQVSISRGVFNSFTLTMPNSNRSVKVKRVK